MKYKVNIKQLLFCLVFLSLAFFVNGQNSNISKLNTVDGLGNNFITCFAQDKNGHMWIGTNIGLYEYDGSQFLDYTTSTNVSVANNHIHSLLFDDFNNLYVGTEKGLSILNSERNKAAHFLKDQEAIHCIKKISNGNIWVINHKISVFKQAKFISTLKIDPKLNFLGYLTNDVIELNQTQFQFNLINAFINQIEIKNDSITHIINSQQAISKMGMNGTLYSLSKEGYLFSEHNGKEEKLAFFEIIDKGSGEIMCIDKNGNIYLSLNKNHLYKYNITTKAVTYLTSNIENINYINAIYADLFNRIWIGTDKGVFILEGKEKQFKNFEVVDPNGIVLKSLSTRKIIELNNKDLLAAYNNNLVQIKLQSNGKNTFNFLSSEHGKPLNMESNSIKRRIDFTEKYNISSVYDLIDDGQQIWSSGLGIQKWNTNDNFLTQYLYLEGQSEKEFLFPKNNFCLANDGQLLWVGNLSHLAIFNLKTEEYIKFKDINNKEFFAGHAIWDILYYNNTIWIASNNGLFTVNPKSKIVSKIILDKNSNSEINTLCIDAENWLWIGTVSQGIFKYHIQNKIIKQYTKKNGLSNNTIASIFKDQQNRIWVSTYFGLNYFDSKNENFVSFYEKDGLQNNELNRKAFCTLSNGEIIVGGISGYSIFNPNQVIKGLQKIKLKCNYFTKINEKGTVEKHSFANDAKTEITLQAGDKLLNIYFALNDFYQNNEHKYYYQISGKVNEWQPIEKQNFLSIASLAAGDYIVKIKGSLANGFYAENEIQIKLIVKQVFYKTWWFLSLLFLLVTAVISYFYHLRINNLRRLANLRTKIASDLHDEVGGNLVRISMLSEKLKRESKNEIDKNEFNDISGMSRGVISSMKDVIWSIDSRNDSMQDLIERMQEYLYDMLSTKNIEYNFKQEDILEIKKIDLVFRQNVFLIFKESINNIVKHANATEVEILFKKENKSIILNIKDNGNNTNNKPVNTGQGLKNMQMRARQLNAVLEQKFEQGFHIILVIPI